MNWARALIAGLVAGVAAWVAEFVMHGFILGSTYIEYDEVFTQEAANPLSFLAVAAVVGIFAAVLFAKTRASWAPGIAGGAAFGFWVGLVMFFTNHYYPLVIEGFPYYLAWCWGGVDLITFVVYGAVIGLIYKG